MASKKFIKQIFKIVIELLFSFDLFGDVGQCVLKMNVLTAAIDIVVYDFDRIFLEFATNRIQSKYIKIYSNILGQAPCYGL